MRPRVLRTSDLGCAVLCRTYCVNNDAALRYLTQGICAVVSTSRTSTSTHTASVCVRFAVQFALVSTYLRTYVLITVLQWYMVLRMYRACCVTLRLLDSLLLVRRFLTCRCGLGGEIGLWACWCCWSGVDVEIQDCVVGVGWPWLVI